MNILVITTGGTIGSAFDGGAVDVSAARSAAVVEQYRTHRGGVTFAVQSPVNILSESVTAAELNTLARVILQIDDREYDGVIFTCGSDNLGYLSAFIGLLTCRWTKPVAVVASDRVLSDPPANGYPNFCCAVELIKRGERGAYVPYRNADGTMLIHAAADIRQADQSPDFFSFHAPFGVLENGAVIQRERYIAQTIPAVFDRDHLPVIGDSIALIHPYPLLDYSALNLQGKKAVLHTLYHSATLDSERAVTAFRPLIEAGVPVYLSSLRSGKALYKTTADMIAAGAIPLYDISPECAYMKLLLAASQDQMPIRAFMEA